MWKKIKSFFTNINALEHSTQVIETLDELEQVLEASQLFSNVTYSNSDTIDDMIQIDNRLIATSLVVNCFCYFLKVIKYIKIIIKLTFKVLTKNKNIIKLLIITLIV